ncbi:MAG: endopeptidase La, partial [Clostridia bacterium]|nr:endopeptidase La [Clostridia bacterium]
ICTALLSALSNTEVRHDVAMTGEVTLRGRVLAIGGLREKTMAAFRNNIKTVVIPAANEPDLIEVDEAVRNAIRFVPVKSVDEVFRIAFNSVPDGHKADDKEQHMVEAIAASKPSDSSVRNPVTC